MKTDLRIRAAYASDSTNFPYDTQITELQIQSRDYSKVFIEINTESMNKAYGLDKDAKEMEPTEKLDVMKNDLFGSRNVSFWVVKRVSFLSSNFCQNYVILGRISIKSQKTAWKPIL